MKPLTVHLVLDRSGSMNIIRDITIKSVNDYMAKLATDAPGSRFSLTLFDTGVVGDKGMSRIDTVIADEDIANVTPLDHATYTPDGGTPLYDAIGKVITQMDKETGDKALVIVTDGEENASLEYTKESIKKLLDERQQSHNWLVLYLGANQDAFSEGAKFGSQAGTTMSYSTSNMAQTMGSAAAATARYADTRLRASAAFTDEEREAATK